MTAYSSTDLYNKYIQEQASEALQSACINDETHKKILKDFPSKLYTPNFFIRIALEVLTIVAIFFSALLLGLIFGVSGSAGAFGFCIFLAILCYGMLELMIKRKHYFNAGVDNILMLSTVGSVVSAFALVDYTNQPEVISAVIVLVCLGLSIRFTDAFMATASYVSLLVLIFLLYTKMGFFGKATVPFVIMIISAVTYFIAGKLFKKDRFLFYRFPLKVIMLLCLVGFYFSGNYFAVHMLGGAMFDSNANLTNTIPLGWFFWTFTIVVPFAYALYGIRKTDFLFIRTGLASIGAAVLTLLFYYPVLSGEVVMLIAGTILVGVSYALIRYLKTPRRGFTFANMNAAQNDVLNVEALIIAQTFGQKVAVDNKFEFGGGSSGGGGASGNY